ncbi:hypothetical protein [Rhodococcus sp. HNM0569]|uniref:hypothetical protein n=1 Tax=Rhodococcus sp. HNM0569 TaxID=2716340 RepID=UPI00146EB037|nr:hypothetical protein [Rhodococcus sp. HNM0569]NLU84203.1 hypothetical protein [Rhodococcus sp. HNM0569]
MPPQRRKNTPANAPKGRRPYVAGTRGRTPRDAADAPGTEPPEVDAPEADVPGAEAPETPVPVEPAPDAKESKPDLTKPAEPAPEATEPTEPESKPEKAPAAPVAWKPIAAVFAAAVVFAAIAVVAAIRPGFDADTGNQAWVDAGATSEVTAATTEGLESLYSYSYDTIDADFDKARGFLTEDKRKEFDETADTTKQAAQQTKTATQADVTDIGVVRLEGDNAEVLAHLNVSATGDAVAQGSAATPVVVHLTNVDGKWLLSDISDNQA